MFSSGVYAMRLYFRYRYDYIEWGHGYDFPAILLLSYLLPIKFFIYLHGNDILCPLRNPILKKLFELTLQRSSGLICNSTFTRDFISQKFNFNTPTHIINPIIRVENLVDKAKIQQYLEKSLLNFSRKYNIE